jgi:biopolymer transport protein ExbB
MADSILQYLRQGGPTLAVLLVMSLLAVGVGIERLCATWIARKRLGVASDRLLECLKNGDPTMARAVNSTLPTHPGATLFGLLLGIEWVNIDQVKRMQRRIVRSSKSRMWILATIGATSPFVGLFGTVLGIMTAFHRISSEGSGGFQVVSGGISEALITTAAGIFVGVEAMVLFNYLQAQTANFAAELKDAAEELTEAINPEAPMSQPAIDEEANRGLARTAARG